MSRQLDELAGILKLLIDEHRVLLAEVERHQVAIKTMDVAAMETSRVRQEAIRLKIGQLESRRGYVMQQLAGGQKLPSPTLTKLAELNPQAKPMLLKLRDELRNVIDQISQRTRVAAKVTTAVLAHLNTVVRILGGAMQQAGVYTRQGMQKLPPRIGVIEAVG
jgi:FlgN protein